MPAESQENDRPLAGKRIVVTRPRAQADAFVRALEELGARVMLFPTIEVRPLHSEIPAALSTPFDWIVFTSANAVESFFTVLEETERAQVDVGAARICAVGPATAEAVQHHGASVDLIPEVYVAEAVLEALRVEIGSDFKGKRILLPRGNIARKFLPLQLREHGAEVVEWTVYETVCPQTEPEAIDALVKARPDLVTFTSASSAQNFCTLLGEARLNRLNKATAFVSIGPATTEAATQLGMRIDAQPGRHDIEGLVEELIDWSTPDE